MNPRPCFVWIPKGSDIPRRFQGFLNFDYVDKLFCEFQLEVAKVFRRPASRLKVRSLTNPTGATWHPLSDEYPSPSNCWRGLNQREEKGVWPKAWRTLLGALDEKGCKLLSNGPELLEFDHLALVQSGPGCAIGPSFIGNAGRKLRSTLMRIRLAAGRRSGAIRNQLRTSNVNLVDS